MCPSAATPPVPLSQVRRHRRLRRRVQVDDQVAQRVHRVLVVGHARTAAGELLVLDLKQGGERTVPVADVLADPVKYFGELGGQRNA